MGRETKRRKQEDKWRGTTIKEMGREIAKNIEKNEE